MKSPARIPLFVLSVTCLCLASLPARTLNIPYVEATGFEHSFSPAYCEFSQIAPGYIREQWEQPTEIEAFTANLSEYDTVECGLSAGPDKQFVVKLPPDATKGYITATVLFQRPEYGDSSLWADSYTVELQGLSGQATETYSYAYVGQNGNVLKATVTYEITDDVSFATATPPSVRQSCKWTSMTIAESTSQTSPPSPKAGSPAISTRPGPAGNTQPLNSQRAYLTICVPIPLSV